MKKTTQAKKRKNIKRTKGKQRDKRGKNDKKEVEDNDRSESIVDDSEEEQETWAKGKTKKRSMRAKTSALNNKQTKLEDYKIKPEKEKEQHKSTYPSCPTKGKLKFISWNINGLRALLRTSELDDLITKEDPDFISFCEWKVDPKIIETNAYTSLKSDIYKSIYLCPEEIKGYSGVGLFTKYEPLSVRYGINNEDHDNEGRVITAEFEKFYFVICYTPNSGIGLQRLSYRVEEWDKCFFKYINELKQKKDIILAGDLNVAYENIDIYDPKGKSKTAGFTNEEKASFKEFLADGYIDTFREKHPDEKKFSFFSTRGNNMKGENRGWRLDYFIVNENKKFEIEESDMLEKDEYNSADHVPIKWEIVLN